MSQAAMMQFYAVIKDHAGATDLRKVDLENEFQASLSALFLEQATELIGEDVKPQAYHATYTPSPDTISEIDPFETPDLLARGMRRQQEFARLEMPFTPEAPVVKAVLGVDDGTISGTPGFYFQHFDRTHILKKGLVAMFLRGRFQRMEDPGVTIGDRLTAVVRGGKLLFRSFARTSQFLDLTQHFRESSDSEIRKMLGHAKFGKVDPDSVLAECGPRTRRRFSLLQHIGILDHESVTPDSIRNGMAKFFGIKLKVSVDKLTQGRSLDFPETPKLVDDLLLYLTDSIYVSELTGEYRASNSHRPLKGPAPQD